jgi:hypothetical protein
MMDFSNAGHNEPDVDLDTVRTQLANSAGHWVPHLYPNGQRIRGNEWRVGDLSGTKGLSLSIDLNDGVFQDFATGERGDCFELLMAANEIPFNEAVELALNITNVVPKTAPRIQKTKPDVSYQVHSILNQCEPAAARQPAHVYFQSRGLTVPKGIMFNEALSHWPTKSQWPALVAPVKDLHGVVKAIHRTYLKPDGNGKADIEPNRMMLGDCIGHAVQLSEFTDTLGVAEGIETALSAQVLTGVSCWAVLSTSGMRNFIWPECLKSLVIFRDAGTPGKDAADALSARALQAGLDVHICSPKSNDDFNTDLCLKN